MNELSNDIESILIDAEELDSIVRRIASEIDADYAYIAGRKNHLLLLGVLKGSVVFMRDLMNHMKTQ